MRNKLFSLLILFSPVILVAQTNPIAIGSQDSAWIRDNYTKTELYITMRDGVKLFTTVYAPKDKSAKSPFLLSRTP